MFDKDGVISSERNDLSALQKKIFKRETRNYLRRCSKGADVFLGLSAGNILPDMLLGMANDPIVLHDGKSRSRN
jgi:malate dehydrogenase (oxaloacetate-decarboxylating)(NADP+)